MPPRAYRRLENEERRRLLVERATELFGEFGYEELSMSRIAREAGISKPLLYHYFPGKKALFAAALQTAAEELSAATAPDPSRPAGEQLAASLLAFLQWIDAHRAAYGKLLRSLAVAEVRELIDEVRDRTVQQILDGIGAEGEATGRPRAPPCKAGCGRSTAPASPGSRVGWTSRRRRCRACCSAASPAR